MSATAPCSAAPEATDGLVVQALRSATAATLELDGVADDMELPGSLRGKGLIRGKPVAVWPLGRSQARDGRVFHVDDAAVESLLADGNSQIVPFTYSHEEDPIHGADGAGYMLHFVASGGFIFADRVYWTRTAAEKIASGDRGFVSPDAYCEPLDPDSLAPLPPGTQSNTYRPRLWRAASLVGVPALRNLPPASLHAARPTSLERSTGMNPKLMELLGLAADATEAHKAEALASLRGTLGLTATGRQALAAQETWDLPAIVGLLRGAYKVPDAFPDKVLIDLIKDAIQAAEGVVDDDEVEAPEPVAETAAASPGPPADAMPPTKAMDSTPPEKEQEMEKLAAAALKTALPGITDTVRQELKARDRADAIDRELLAAEKAGKLVAAERESFRKMFDVDEALARTMLSSRSTGPTVPSGEVVGGTLDPSVSVDRLPLEEANEILSRAAGFSAAKNVDFSIALRAVRGGDAEERAFHAQILSSNPDWGQKSKSGKRGTSWPVSLRPGLSSVELDPDMLKHIGKSLKAGAIPTNLVPAPLQEAALRRMSLAGEVSSFQPTTRFPVPGFAFGFYQGEFGGSEIAPEVAGGANEEASYPVYGTEKLSVHVNASGVPEPVGRNASDMERSHWGADFKKVTLRGYGNEVWADRRDQAAGDAVLPEGVMATVTAQALTIEKNKKELVQAATTRATASYTSGYYKDLNSGTRQWNNPESTPVQDWQGARMTIWRATGVFPDISLLPPDVIETLKFHKDFLVAAQYAGMGDAGRPNAMVPIEMLVSILGPIVVPTCRISTTPGGASPASPWGQDVILAVTSKGKVIAPRAFATIVSAGYPIVRGLVDERSGLNGSDGIKVSDMYAIDVVGVTSATTVSAYLFQHAVKQLEVVS